MSLSSGIIEQYGPWAIFAIMFVWLFVQNRKDSEARFAAWRQDQERLYAIIESNTAAMTGLRDQQKESNNLLRQLMMIRVNQATHTSISRGE